MAASMSFWSATSWEAGGGRLDVGVATGAGMTTGVGGVVDVGAQDVKANNKNILNNPI